MWWCWNQSYQALCQHSMAVFVIKLTSRWWHEHLCTYIQSTARVFSDFRQTKPMQDEVREWATAKVTFSKQALWTLPYTGIFMYSTSALLWYHIGSTEKTLEIGGHTTTSSSLSQCGGTLALQKFFSKLDTMRSFLRPFLNKNKNKKKNCYLLEQENLCSTSLYHACYLWV